MGTHGQSGTATRALRAHGTHGRLLRARAVVVTRVASPRCSVRARSGRSGHRSRGTILKGAGVPPPDGHPARAVRPARTFGGNAASAEAGCGRFGRRGVRWAAALGRGRGQAQSAAKSCTQFPSGRAAGSGSADVAACYKYRTNACGTTRASAHGMQNKY